MRLRPIRIAELKVRGRQGANIAAERLGLSKIAQIPTDSSLLGFLDPALGINSTVDLFEHFRSSESVFYRSLNCREDVVGLLHSRFSTHATSIIEKAEKICAGRFDLLGYRDLRFGGVMPDWHYDPVSNKTSPRLHWSRIGELNATETGDKKVIWELNRHQYFSTLGQAYWLTKNEKYAEVFFDHLEDWENNNIPKVGVNWLSSLEIAFRAISWIWGYHFFKSSSGLGVESFTRMLKYLYLFGRHLETYLSTYFSPNTHLTGEALGLYFLGSFLGDFKSGKRWKNLGYQILMDALDFQVRPDGVYCEQSSHYQRYTTDFYLNLAILRGLEGAQIEPELQIKLNLLLDFLLHITQPNGETQLFGDDDGGRLFFLDSVEINDFRPTLALGAAVMGRADLKFVANEAGPELLWLLGPDGLRHFDQMDPEVPATTVKAFPDGGFYVARSSWSKDADFLLIDCGPHGFLNGGHAHADALNVVLSLRGRPLFIDSGTFSYASDPTARDIFRSTGAHNCLTANEKGSSTPAGPFAWSSVADCRLLEWNDDGKRIRFCGEHNGFSGSGVDYFRTVEVSRQRAIEIIDRISGAKEQPFEINFILAPDLNVKIDSFSVIILDGERAIAKIQTTASNHVLAEWVIEDWKVSFRYGALSPTKRLRLLVRGGGDIEIVNEINHL